MRVMGPRIISSSFGVVKSKIPLQKLIVESLKQHGDELYMIEYETRKVSSFSQLLDDCLKFSEALRKLKLRPGDIFIVFGFNCYEFLVAFISGIIVGGTAMSMRGVDTHYEVKHTLLWTEAKFLFVTAEKRETAKYIRDELPNFHNVILFDVEYDDTFPTIRSLIYENNCKIDEENIYEPKDENEVALILESSGTSGAMKATKICHYDLATAFSPENSPSKEPKSKQDVNSGHSHMAHLSGLSAHLRSIVFGDRVVSFRTTDVNKFLDAVERYKISRAVLTPSMLNLINKIDKNVDMSSLQHIMIGGSRVSPQIIETFLKKHEIKELRNCYAMTELTAIATVSENKNNYEAIGTVCPGIEMKVVSTATGQLLGENETGELRIRGAIKFKGYFNDEKATKELVDNEGFIHTGDIGYFDENENFYVVDRIKDIIKQHGYSYSPVDVEDILLQHEAVKEAAVVGIPYGFEEEISHAFVVLKDKFKDKIMEEDLLHFVNSRTSKIREVKGGLHYLNEIPKTEFGKILRRKLRNEYLKFESL